MSNGSTAVIVVDAVLHHQLPIGRNVVFLHARDDLHRPDGDWSTRIRCILGVAEIVGQRLDVGLRDMNQKPILLETGRPLEAEAALVEALRIGSSPGTRISLRRCRRSSHGKCT